MDGKFDVAPFYRIGARAGAASVPGLRGDLRLDVKEDRRGEYFEIRARPEVRVHAVDIRPDMRHLLLVSVNERNGNKSKFLCGHDEREWFVAAVPEARGVRDVLTAMEALKPPGVRELQERLGVRARDRVRRRTRAYVRQGEWFFTPAPEIAPKPAQVRRDEPLSRGAGSKAHMAQFAFRFGGTPVYVSSAFPMGLTEKQYRRILLRQPERTNDRWQMLMRNPQVYVRGRIAHPDHATIVLDRWHRVQMNEEWRAPAMQHVAFLD